MAKLFRRLIILAFCFVVCGAIGSALFFVFFARASARSDHYAAGRWANSQTSSSLHKFLGKAFWIGGVIGVIAGFKLLRDSDNDVTSLDYDDE